MKKVSPDVGVGTKQRPATARALRVRPDRKGYAWFEIPGRFLGETGVILIREPSGTSLSTLLDQFRSGTYTKPFVVDDGEMRRLHFDLRFVQSQMSLENPDELVLSYTQKMMAFLLFVPNPRHIVIVGLGGGSLTKFCIRQLPNARVTTLEIDPNVIGLAELFKIPSDEPRLRIIQTDAAAHFAVAGDGVDVAMLDGCDDSGISASFCDEDFYRNLRRRLRPHGILIVNLIGLQERSNVIENMVANQFEGCCVTLSVAGGNRILFAFNDSQSLSDWSLIRQRAVGLASQTGLDFRSFARLLSRNFKAQRRQF